MKLTRAVSWLLVAAFFCSSVMALVAGNPHRSTEGFSVKEYEDFHHLLHELQHDALPKKDYARIRSKAAELIKLGEAIVVLGVPQGTAAEKVAEFKKELETFGAALAKFGTDAKDGSDQQMIVSYEAVHESFETLAHLLPRKS